MFTFNASTGAWTYLVDNSKAVTQALSSGQVVYDTLTVTSSDGTATQDIKIAINGTAGDAIRCLERFTVAAAPLEDLNVEVLLSHRVWCLERMRATSYNKHRRHLRALINFALAEGHIQSQPFELRELRAEIGHKSGLPVKPDDQVFCLPLLTPGRIKSPRMLDEHISRAFEALSRHLGYTVSAHRVRHTSATVMLERSGNIKAVSDMLGHADIKLTASTCRKTSKDELLPTALSERMIGLQKLIGQVQTMVEESGNPKGFNAAHWIAQWLEQPLGALGGQKPAHFMDTIQGQELVSDVLARMQSGAYA
eukprot:gene5631-5509_t